MKNGVTFYALDGRQSSEHLDELRDLYLDVYADPPYEWGAEHADLFAERFSGQAAAAGFALVEARSGADLAGIAFGVTLQPTSPWWHNLLEPLSEAVATEHPGRTSPSWNSWSAMPGEDSTSLKRCMTCSFSAGRRNEPTLTVLPAAIPAQRAYAKWGWHHVARKRNPLPGSPVFDVLVKDLSKG